ncbi:T9SS type A sorting domain-containing protein [bacterium]|nr:T9SS type A sorting domain-containing protein [bacterium]
MKIIYILVVFLLSQNNLFSQWYLQDEYTTNELKDIFFLEGPTGWTVGNFGTVLRTDNGGENWNIIYNSKERDEHFEKVFFTDSNTGYCLTYHGKVFKTTDGGYNWEQISQPLDYGYDIFFINNKIGWIIGGEVNYPLPYLAEYKGKIGKTTDSGLTWTTQSFNATDIFHTAYFSSDSNGWLAGQNGEIFYTRDSGDNWELQYDSKTVLESSFFFDDSTGWFCGHGNLVLKTIDAGKTWQEISLNTDCNFLNDIYFIDKYRGWLCGSYASNSYIYSTLDGGSNWQLQNLDSLFSLNSIIFRDSQSGWSVGYNGSIYRTENGGITKISNRLQETSIDQIYIENFPNPFNSSTTIIFSMPRREYVKIDVFNSLGQLVENLISDYKNSGRHKINWKALNQTSGLYFLMLQTSKTKKIKKVLLIK